MCTLAVDEGLTEVVDFVPGSAEDSLAVAHLHLSI
jgi:hypothetical protein